MTVDRPALTEALANLSFDGQRQNRTCLDAANSMLLPSNNLLVGVAKPHSMVARSKVGHESHEWTRIECCSQIRVYLCDSWLVPSCVGGRRLLDPFAGWLYYGSAWIELVSLPSASPKLARHQGLDQNCRSGVTGLVQLGRRLD